MKAYRLFVLYTAITSFALYGCIGVQRSADCSISMQEPLFGIQCKVMEHGTIGILSKNGSKLKLIRFNYKANLAGKSVLCSKEDESVVDFNSKLVNSFVWLTEEMLRKKEKGSWKEPYYNCFTDGFLDMSNEEKLELLDSLSNTQ